MSTKSSETLIDVYPGEEIKTLYPGCLLTVNGQPIQPEEGGVVKFPSNACFYPESFTYTRRVPLQNGQFVDLTLGGKVPRTVKIVLHSGGKAKELKKGEEIPPAVCTAEKIDYETLGKVGFDKTVQVVSFPEPTGEAPKLPQKLAFTTETKALEDPKQDWKVPGE